MDAIARLRHEHREISERLARLADVPADLKATRERQFRELQPTLLHHLRLESECLLSLAAERDHERIEQRWDDDAQLEAQIAEMAGAPADSARWTERLYRLRDAFEQHVAEDERLFPELPPSVSEEAGHRMERLLNEAGSPGP